MDEGRLAVVFRQEEQHRKFVYMMNDIIRSQFSLYNNCLAREQHETSVKLIKNCAEVRRSVVRQKVLRKCLEMRKRKIVTRDPTGRFGMYGGKPLWAMSRDIDRVIADNHPKIRRLKRVEAVMRQSRETGAILDEDAVSRRMEAFFQLKESRKEKDKSPERPKDVFQAPVRRRNIFHLPSMGPAATAASQDSSQEKSPQDLVQDRRRSSTKDIQKESSEERESSGITTQQPAGPERRRSSEIVGVVNRLSLEEDSQGRLRGIRTTREYTAIEDTEDDDRPDQEGEDVKNGKQTQRGDAGGSDTRSPKSQSKIPADAENDAEQKTSQYRGDDVRRPSRSRSKLILPPIQSSKNFVTRT